MTIQSSVPISLRRPGVYTELEFVDNVQGLVPLPRRVVIVAEAKGGSATIELPVQVFSEAEADAKFGVGSMCALMCRMAFAAGQLVGNTTEIWGCPIAEPGGGVAAAQTITVTGPATQSGSLVLQIAGRIINVGVNNGDSANTVATAIKAAIDALKTSLPITAGLAAPVVTCTHATKGVNGNDVAYATIQGVPGLGIALAQSVAGAGAAVITNALAALYDQRYHAIATSNHTTTDITAELTDLALAWGFQQANYRFYFMGSRDSIGTAQSLQAAADNFPIHVVVCEQAPRLPGELAVAVAEAWMSFDAPNINMDNVIIPLEPPNGTYAFSDAEVESALSGGLTPLVPAGGFSSIVRLVTSQISVSLADTTPVELLRESAVPRTSALLAENVDIRIAAAVPQASATQEEQDLVRDIVIEVDRTFEQAGYIDSVDAFLNKISTAYASSPIGRMLATNPHHVVPPLHQVAIKSTSYAAVPAGS